MALKHNSVDGERELIIDVLERELAVSSIIPRRAAEGLLAALVNAGYQLRRWHPMDTAPKDGTKVDLLFPYPISYRLEYFWATEGPMAGAWCHRRPTYTFDGVEPPNGAVLLPEDKWDWQMYPNMEPLAWTWPMKMPT